MKTTKLRGHEFRYLVKEHVKNPLNYIENFFGHETDIQYWLRDIHLLINAAACPEMINSEIKHSTGYTCKQLIEQVEAAYVIFRKQDLKEETMPLDFFPTHEDLIRYANNGAYTINGEINPLNTIAKFFSYQNLERWYYTLDELWMGLTSSGNEHNDRFGDRVLVIRELLLRLAQAMYHLSERPDLLEVKAAKNESEYTESKQIEENTSNSQSITYRNKLKYPFEYTWLEDWQKFLSFWEISIPKAYAGWEDAFREYKPADQIIYTQIMRNLFEHINEIVSNLFHVQSEKENSRHSISLVSTKVKQKNKVYNIESLSLAEIAAPEYYLPRLFWKHSLQEWKILLDDWTERSLNTEPFIMEEDEAEFPNDFMKLRKIIEISFLITHQDEIEFIHHENLQENDNSLIK